MLKLPEFNAPERVHIAFFEGAAYQKKKKDQIKSNTQLVYKDIHILCNIRCPSIF